MISSQKKQRDQTAPDLRSVSTDSTLTTTAATLFEPFVVNSGFPALKIGTYIQIYWAGDDKWYKGYVVGINEQKTVIDVMYLDGQFRSEILAEICYEILPNSTKKNITIKDNESGFTYCISKVDATVTKTLTVQTAAAGVENTSKKKRQTSSSSSAASDEEGDTKRFKDANEETKYYKKAAAALPKQANKPLLFSTTTTTTTQPYEPPMTEAEKLRSLAKKLADEKNALAKQKAEIEQRENEIAVQMLEQQRKINEDDFKVINTIATNVKNASGEISYASALIVTITETLNNLTKSNKSLSQENKNLILGNLQMLFQDSDSNVSLDYIGRTTLIKNLDKLNAAIAGLKNSLSLPQPENGVGSTTTNANKPKKMSNSQ